MPPHKKSGKILPLEALRGMAAISVVFCHFAEAFAPQIMNHAPAGKSDETWIGSPLFLLINGSGMVIIFFVLSGYVLALKGLHPNAGRVLADAACKRWFRFAPIITLSLLLSYALYNAVFALNAHYQTTLPQDHPPSLSAILYEGLFGSLFLGENTYNGVLWSMQLEFYGSMAVFAMALLLAPGRLGWLIVTLVLAGALLLNVDIRFFPFLCGLAAVALGLHKKTMGRGMTFSALVLGLYLCGYYLPERWYGWLAFVDLPKHTFRVIVTTIGGFLLLMVFATHNPVSRRFSGSFSRALGNMSFPLYLTHGLIITSLCTWAYAYAGGRISGDIAAVATFLVMAPPFVVMLARFDEYWVGVLSRWRPFNGRGSGSTK